MKAAATIEERLREIALMNMAGYRFSHYRFVLECHPDDDVEALKKDINDLHIN